MKLYGSIEVWREHDGSLSIYETDYGEETNLGSKMSPHNAMLLFELTARRLRGKS